MDRHPGADPAAPLGPGHLVEPVAAAGTARLAGRGTRARRTARDDLDTPGHVLAGHPGHAILHRRARGARTPLHPRVGRRLGAVAPPRGLDAREGRAAANPDPVTTSMTALPPAGTAGPASSPAVDHRTLLRTYEPVLWFTEGELFLPTSVGPYVAQCSLRAGGPDRSTAPLVPAGRLTLDRLGELGEQLRDRPLYLRYVQQPLQRAEARGWRRQTRPRLRGTARLAAVGVLARLVDVVLRLSLLVRGRVPRGLEIGRAHV